jgi:hypothetical protein
MLNSRPTEELASVFEQFATEAKQQLASSDESWEPSELNYKLRAVYDYADQGWAVFPADIRNGEKKSFLSAEFSGGHRWGASADPKVIFVNFTKRKWRDICGVGIPTGAEAGIFVAETDTKKGRNGEAELRKLEAKHGKLPDTRMAMSPSGSKHRYFKHPGSGIKVKNSVGEIAPGVDVRGDGGMVIAPPSVRSDGVYVWLNDLPVAEAPQWLLDLVCEKTKAEDTESIGDNVTNGSGERNTFEQVSDDQGNRGSAWAEKALSNVAGELAETEEGYRNHKLYKCGFRLGTMIARNWIARDVVERGLKAAAVECGLIDRKSKEGLSAVNATIKSGINGGLKRPHEDLADASTPTTSESMLKTKLMQTSAEFVAGYAPPDYLIDGLLQRRYVYSFTGPTGSGKTTIALLIAAHVARGMELAGREVEKGCVLFFAGENPDDVRSRWIKLCEELGEDPDNMDVVFMPFTLNLSEKQIRKQIDDEAAKHGPFSLLIVDTSASYYSGDDENDNVALGNHARMLRTFIKLPGGPTVLVTCHSVKNPDMNNLLPRGGGAFLAEVDGNLVCITDSTTLVAEVTTHGKFRGPDFAPFSFKLVRSRSEKLVDTKGRLIWSVFARPLSDEEVEAINKGGRSEQDDVLRAMLDEPGRSLLELAEHLHWLTMEGKPNKQKVHRMMDKLKQDKLVKKNRGDRYVLTNAGEEEAKKTPENPVRSVPREK